MKLITWNVGGRTGRLKDQIRTLRRQEADLICLQEVRESTLPGWREALPSFGLEHVADSAGRSDRRLFNLTASRWPLTELEERGLPQPERLLSVRVHHRSGPVEVHNLHVPPLRGRGSDKLGTLTAVHDALAVPSSSHRILCGDFNTVSRESADPATERFGRWVTAESLLLRDLAGWDLHDVFRRLHGYAWDEVTRSNPGHHRMAGRRLDHILASASLGATFCEYQHGWRQEGFSDHSAVEAIFEPGCAGVTRRDG